MNRKSVLKSSPLLSLTMRMPTSGWRRRSASPVLVDEWLELALKAELEANLEEAEALYEKARATSPGSKAANHRLGRFLYDIGRLEQVLQTWREHGMLLDVPRLSKSPLIDGLRRRQCLEGGGPDGHILLVQWRTHGGHSLTSPIRILCRLYGGGAISWIHRPRRPS
jgi:hypothetical protein